MNGNGISVVAILILIAGSSTAIGQEWPRFRGPNGIGVSNATTVPVKWSANNYNWKIRLPGKGHSSPVLWGKRIFVTSGDEKSGSRYVLCVHADTGKVLWQKTYSGVKLRHHADNSFASATPAADKNRVYLTWGNAKEYLIIALDHHGKQVWRKDLGPYKAGHGFGVSPIVHGGLLVVANEQNGPSSLLGLDSATGKIRWKAPRKSRATYSTPCVFRPKNGSPQLIFTNYEHGVTSIDPKNGNVNWEMDIFHKGHLETSISSPIVTSELVLATSGWLGVRMEVIAVRPPMNDKTQPQRVYDIHRSMPLCTTPLVKDDLLFVWSDRGVVTCADVHTGKLHWQKRVDGAYYSSPICVGAKIYNISREGDMLVLAAGKKYQPLARNSLGEGSHSTPAVAHGRMYVRTFSRLMSIGRGK